MKIRSTDLSGEWCYLANYLKSHSTAPHVISIFFMRFEPNLKSHLMFALKTDFTLTFEAARVLKCESDKAELQSDRVNMSFVPLRQNKTISVSQLCHYFGH